MKLEHNIGFRIIAYIIDFVLVMVIGLILGILFEFGVLQTGDGGFFFHMSLWETTLVASAYFIGFALINKGKTVGKILTNIEIYDGNVKELSTSNLVVREAIKVLLLFPSIISFLFVVIRKDNRSIHDILVHSQVLRKVVDKEYIYQVMPSEEREIENE